MHAGPTLPMAVGSIPGPVDRASFFDEQQRNRRATWRLSFFCGLTIVAMGMIISAIVTPAFVFELAVLIGVVDFFLPLPAISHSALNAYGSMINNVSAGTQHPIRFSFGLVELVAPGLLVTYLLWRWLHRVFLRYGVGGVVLSLGAREPRSNDFEEQQLVNVVQEMAIADGIAAPQVMLLDSPAANAGMIGSSPETATMVVSRRLLDDLDRAETQGVLGHLIGAAGNGDLGIAMKIVAVFQTYGLLMTVLMFPMSRNARRAVWELIKLSFGGSGKDGSRVELVNGLLLRASTPTGMDDINEFLDFDRTGISRFRKVFMLARAMIFFPLALGMIFAYIVLLLVVLFLLGPLLAFTWRTRCYLADATAVQLTRDPDGLSRALQELTLTGGLIPGSQGVSHLFIVGAEAAKGRSLAQFQTQLTKLQGMRSHERTENASPTFHDELRRTLEEQTREQAALESETFEEKQGIIVPFHPSLHRRLKHLAAMGART